MTPKSQPNPKDQPMTQDPQKTRPVGRPKLAVHRNCNVTVGFTEDEHLRFTQKAHLADKPPGVFAREQLNSLSFKPPSPPPLSLRQGVISDLKELKSNIARIGNLLKIKKGLSSIFNKQNLDQQIAEALEQNKQLIAKIEEQL